MLILGVTGSIAAYKAADLASQITQLDIEVRVVMTRKACEFVTPLTFKALTGHQVLTDENFSKNTMPHISWTDEAKLFLIAPASADILARLSIGLADDILTTTALAVRCPLWVAPAMNTRMWEHAATRENVVRLKKRGVNFLEPDSGDLACGHTGPGRLQEVPAILNKIQTSEIFE